jgi:hypothetical protein
MTGRRTLQVLMMVAGLVAWAVQFTIIYGVTSTVCARGWAEATFFGIGIVPAVILLATLAAWVVTAGVLLFSLRAHPRLETGAADRSDVFLNNATSLISGLSLVTIAWHGLPALLLPACA